jgi:hypothetical protein
MGVKDTMRYLELDQLVVGTRYVCVPYDTSEEITVTYTGDGNFEDDEYTYTVYGDIRYVLRPA